MGFWMFSMYMPGENNSVMGYLQLRMEGRICKDDLQTVWLKRISLIKMEPLRCYLCSSRGHQGNTILWWGICSYVNVRSSLQRAITKCCLTVALVFPLFLCLCFRRGRDIQNPHTYTPIFRTPHAASSVSEANCHKCKEDNGGASLAPTFINSFELSFS